MILLYLVLHTGAIPLSTAYFGRGNATILVQDFGCTGREETLQMCTPSNYSISSYYSHGYNVPNRYVHSAKHFLLHMILQCTPSNYSISSYYAYGYNMFSFHLVC